MSYQVFRVVDERGAYTGGNYRLDGIDGTEAANVGCPTADHKITGRHATIYGNLTEVTGRWTRRGVYAQFSWGTEPDGNYDQMRGYVR